MIRIEMVFDLKKNEFIPVLFILMFFWALMHPFSKMIAGDVSHVLMAFLRNALGTLTLLGLIWLKKRNLKIHKNDILPLVLLGIFGTALSSLFLFMGIELSTATNASILVNTNPIFIALLAPFLIHEKLKRKQLLGVATAFLGMALVASNGLSIEELINSKFFLGNLLLLASALCITVYTIYGKKFIKKYGGMVATFYTVLSGALFLLIISIITNDIYSIPEISGSEWLIIAYIGIIITGFIYALWYKSINFIGAARASSFKLLIPVFATLVSIILLGEFPSMITVIGGLLVLGGLILNQKIL